MDNLYRVDSLPPYEDPGVNIPPSVPPRSKSFYIFGRHTHVHNHPPIPPIPQSTFYRNCGLAMGFMGLVISSYACYTYHLSAVASARSADAAVRAADAAEVQIGTMSKEEFEKRHKKL